MPKRRQKAAGPGSPAGGLWISGLFVSARQQSGRDAGQHPGAARLDRAPGALPPRDGAEQGCDDNIQKIPDQNIVGVQPGGDDSHKLRDQQVVLEAALNLVVSVLLAKRLGITGILAGTLVSTLALPVWRGIPSPATGRGRGRKDSTDRCSSIRTARRKKGGAGGRSPAFQIAVLFLTGSYLYYLVIAIGATLVQNLAISRTADRLYPYLREKEVQPLPAETVGELRRNVGAMVLHRIGARGAHAVHVKIYHDQQHHRFGKEVSPPQPQVEEGVVKTVQDFSSGFSFV